MSVTPVLDLRGVGKSFGPVQVLHDVALSAYAGEVTALVGDNGAGKSTLVKCLGGVWPMDRGEYLFEGRPVRVGSPREAAELGIEIVHQDLALCENLDIVQNMFLGREWRNGLVLDEAAMEELAIRALTGLSVRTIKSVRQPVSGLSGGQRQSVAIARAMLWDAKVVVLDEPTAALGVVQTQQILELIERLRDRGHGVIVVSHNLADVFRVADRITVLRLGRVAGNFDVRDATREQVVAAITGAEFGAAERPTEEQAL